MPTDEALEMAENADLDLVEVSPKAKPPVCRLMDYGKFKYQQSKRRLHTKTLGLNYWKNSRLKLGMVAQLSNRSQVRADKCT